MLQITFNYDPETNEVSNVSAVGATVKEKAVAKPRAKKTKAPTGKVILNGQSLKLEQEVLNLLGVEVGDRLCVRFDPNPVLVTPEVANEPKGGNLITKSLTLSVRGKTSEVIAKFGTEFDYDLSRPGYLGLTSEGGHEVDADASLDKPVSTAGANEIDLDDDFNNAVEGGEEVDFVLDI